MMVNPTYQNQSTLDTAMLMLQSLLSRESGGRESRITGVEINESYGFNFATVLARAFYHARTLSTERLGDNV